MPTFPRILCAVLALAAALPTPRAPAATPTTVIREAWISEPVPDEEMDSLGLWRPAGGGSPWLLASAKDGARLLVFDADTGIRIGASGGPGEGPGQFRRPNGVAVAGDLLFVVERDARRVQVLQLPQFRVLGEFGREQLQLPYGIWLDTSDGGAITAYVTDSFMEDFATSRLPPVERLAERVKRYRVGVDAHGALQAEYVDAFGDTGEAGALRMVESIAGDPAHGRMLIAEEDRRVGSTLREYSLQGRYLGRNLPPFASDAEGVVLWDCGGGAGYWIAADQVEPTLFRLFDRDTLAPAGRFTGMRTAGTDGVALGGPTPRFPHGALFALHADVSVAAFDLGEVARRLKLALACRG
ncbi:hypothetical protein [Pseudoxanthomonas sp. J35]|uniref:hypothetical protein n=1 Tax=Pseudoxanthomonas sp. J35 TaxID=935852 RepID=UPI0004B0F149|nr:hypothetical protein [Pseudoxanthomonas sp. J35]